MDWVLSILSVVFIVIGIIGCIVPVLPGVILAYGGLVCSYFCSYSQLTVSSLLFWLALTLVVSVVDYFLPAYMARLFGGSSAGMRGATAGLVIGFLVGNVVGTIIGPFVGAVVGELFHDSKDFVRSLKVGFGSFLSFAVGTGLKLVVSIMMLVRVFGDIYPVVSDSVKSWF